MLRTRMAQAIVTQIGPRARIVRTEALLAVRYGVALYHGARRHVGVRFVVVGVIARAITVVITIVVVARAEAVRHNRTAEPATMIAPVGKVAAPVPVVATGPVARSAVGGEISAADSTVAGPVAPTAPVEAHATAAPASADVH